MSKDDKLIGLDGFKSQLSGFSGEKSEAVQKRPSRRGKPKGRARRPVMKDPSPKKPEPAMTIEQAVSEVRKGGKVEDIASLLLKGGR